MLHRIVSRSVFAFAAMGLLAACEDNTTGTPLTPPPASTAVYVNGVEPAEGYTFEQIVILRPNGPDTTIVITDTTVVVDTIVVGPDTSFVPDTTFVADTTIVTDTTVTVVSPDPVFSVLYPNGDAAEDQVINFSLNLPGLLEHTSGTVDEDGLVSPGYWVVGSPCPPEEDFCRPTQRVIATPAAGKTGFIDINVDTTTAPPPDLRRVTRR